MNAAPFEDRFARIDLDADEQEDLGAKERKDATRNRIPGGIRARTSCLGLLGILSFLYQPSCWVSYLPPFWPRIHLVHGIHGRIPPLDPLLSVRASTSSSETTTCPGFSSANNLKLNLTGLSPTCLLLLPHLPVPCVLSLFPLRGSLSMLTGAASTFTTRYREGGVSDFA